MARATIWECALKGRLRLALKTVGERCAAWLTSLVQTLELAEMKQWRLAEFFTGVGSKRLSAVDAELGRLNQHEIDTTRTMRDDFLGETHQERFRPSISGSGRIAMFSPRRGLRRITIRA